MSSPILLYNPYVSDLARESFTIGNSERITFEEAYSKEYFRKKALQFNRNALSTWPPVEFTQFVLRSSAVNERGCRHFAKKLSPEIHKFLKGLIGRADDDIEIKDVHRCSTQQPSGFRGVFVKYFFKKLIYNLRNEVGRYEYGENFAAIFPFQVLKHVPVQYDVEICYQFNDNFYQQIQSFLDDHFDTADAYEMVPLFVTNIHHFRITRFTSEDLKIRVLHKSCGSDEDYLSSFPRLNSDGIRWIIYLYHHYKNVCKVFDNVDVSADVYDDNYFRTLPESNFFDLYELLNTQLYALRRKQYIERFKKYLFFFVHALEEIPNPVFFIDDILFECLKGLHKLKTSPEDTTLVKEIAKLSLVHLRTKAQLEFITDLNMYHIDLDMLRNIKMYVQKIPNIENARIDVEYKTDYLHGWMLLRNDDTCYEMCYSRKERKKVDDFVDRILCSILPSDEERIKYVVIYNSFKGHESKIIMPQNVETIRNFVRLSNKYNFVNDTQAESKDEFLTRDLEMYFDHLTIAGEKR